MEDIVIKTHPSELNEQPVRTKRLFWLGVALIIGFAMPLFMPGIRGQSSIEFINISWLFESRVPILAKFMLVWPLAAGIATIIVALLNRGVGRSIALLVLGATPVVVMLSSADIQRGLMFGIKNSTSMATVSGIASIVAWVGLVAGCRALHYTSGNLAARIVAAIGGGLFLAFLFIPVNSQIPFLATFKAFGAPVPAMIKTTHIIGCVGNVIFMLCAMGTSAFCILSLFKRENARRFGDIAFLLLAIGVIVALFAGIIGTFASPFMKQSGFLMMFLTSAIKMLCWLFGLFLLVPLGLADLIINLNKDNGGSVSIPMDDEPVPAAAPAQPSPAAQPQAGEKKKPRFDF